MNSVTLIYGPVLLGGAVALTLSGIVAAQCILFFKLYSNPDESGFKIAMVGLVWTLDSAQSAFILASLFDYFIVHFGDLRTESVIPCKSKELVINRTNCLYCESPPSRNPWGLQVRFEVATGEMLRLKTWAAFSHPYPRLLFTAGLCLSAGTDMVITICLCYYLRKIRKLSSSSPHDHRVAHLRMSLHRLAVANIKFNQHRQWLILPGTSMTLGLNFVIGKLYPNSLLLLLNKRAELRDMHSGDPRVQCETSAHLASYYTDFPHRVPISHYIDSFPLTLTPPPVYGYRPAFKMSQSAQSSQSQPKGEVRVYAQRRVDRDSVAISEVDSFDLQRANAPPRSLGNRSLNWRVLP
ncbi:hypothetical protein K438DRAFT_1943558 [Mycena galopus ATCC 62051]|nr:hypothetical protein K438DRAFT_1943558 [Mycena galopus ATCC 62051]